MEAADFGMLGQSLEHLAKSALVLSQNEKIFVLGSSSILASFPELGEAGMLDNTFDADLLLEPVDKGIFDLLRESIGEGRLVSVAGFENVFALQPLDLAAVKVVVGREKDLALVRRLLELGKIGVAELRERWATMTLGEREMFSSGRNLADVTEGLEAR